MTESSNIAGSRVASRLAVVFLCAGALLADGAEAARGQANASLGERFSVEGCGVDSDVTPVRLEIRRNLTWIARTPEGNFVGTYREFDGARRFVMTMDGKSRARFIRSLEGWASDLCGVRARASQVGPVRIRARLNKKRTRINGTMNLNALGSTSQGSGAARYRGTLSGRYFAGR